MNKPTQVTTGEVRISYEHLLQPYAQQQGSEPKFSASLLIPKSDVATKQKIDAAIQAAMQEGTSGKWGGARPPQPAVPIHDGDGLRPVGGEPFSEECKGHWVMTASSKQRQEIIDTNMNTIIDPAEVYSGMYARVSINFFAYNSNGKKGIGCGLGPIQKTNDGEPLGGRVSAAEAFGGAPAYPQQAPQYQQPAYSQPQAPQYAPPQQYAPQQPAYQQPVPQYQQPQQAPYPQYQPQIDPITGLPVVPVMGI